MRARKTTPVKENRSNEAALGQRAGSGIEALAPTLVEAERPTPWSPLEQAEKDKRELHDEQERQRQEALEELSKATAMLRLPEPNLARGRELRKAFEEGDTNLEVGERLLEEFVAGEAVTALSLSDTEGALTALLQRTIAHPALALEVTKVLREVVALNGAVRRRIQGSLGAAADLRAQRRFLSTNRRAPDGD